MYTDHPWQQAENGQGSGNIVRLVESLDCYICLELYSRDVLRTSLGITALSLRIGHPRGVRCRQHTD